MARGIRDEEEHDGGRADDGYVVSYDARMVGSTELAWRVLLETVAKGVPIIPGNEIWVPKRAVHTDSEVFGPPSAQQHGKFIVETWLAKQRGWLDGEDGSKTKGSRKWFGVTLPPKKDPT